MVGILIPFRGRMHDIVPLTLFCAAIVFSFVQG